MVSSGEDHLECSDKDQDGIANRVAGFGDWVRLGVEDFEEMN